jgi:hypothetical protein
VAALEVTVAEKLELEFTISPDGEVTVKTRGLKGETCVQETKALEERLGVVKAREKTAEWYQRAGAVTGAVKRR